MITRKKNNSKDSLTPNYKYAEFIRLVKTREDTFETNVLLSKPIYIGRKMKYNKDVIKS